MTTINIPQAPEIPEWMDKYGYVDIYSFFVYGEVQEDDVNLLIKGLMVTAEYSTFDKVAIAVDYIGEEEARALNAYRGTSIKFVFAGGYAIIEELLTDVVLDGLNFLRFKSKFTGHTRGDSGV